MRFSTTEAMESEWMLVLGMIRPKWYPKLMQLHTSCRVSNWTTHYYSKFLEKLALNKRRISALNMQKLRSLCLCLSIPLCCHRCLHTCLQFCLHGFAWHVRTARLRALCGTRLMHRSNLTLLTSLSWLALAQLRSYGTTVAHVAPTSKRSPAAGLWWWRWHKLQIWSSWLK